MIDAGLINLPVQSHRHHHHFHQMIVGVSGCADFEVDGLGHRLDRWQGCVVPSDHPHYYCGDPDNRVLVLNLPFGGNDLLPDRVVERLFERPGYFTMDPRLQQLLSLGIQEIQQFPHDQGLAAHVAATFIHGLSHRLGQSQSSPPSPRGRQLDRERLDQFIDAHLGESISVFALAKRVHLSPSQFQRVFKEGYGITPHQYVITRRLQKARELLTDSTLSISEIADHCGFSSQSALTCALQRHQGVTPGQLRRS
ncbi:helix-turn-helix domain-containing protein [Aestuariirhabdus litorea]|uniref:AraC family transcriptional regulator n=1 Tax=Aestuariirhabdus litorea TaxID=2528527 RepID=A0A3P3VU65_9GAMM|nr:AraC family transcriptional regulator [Aestuariirhabdus litorea]RRJ84303.1 AraC family transcriptional regulator [Aestuariirhabdus litorea]RWW97526.1 helix-turn-helix domain-containing protein [Endozoicomonadaceae bacterium GTF-13]